MRDIDFLNQVQLQSGTKPVELNDKYRELFLHYVVKDFGKPELSTLGTSYDDTIRQYQEMELPTPFESIVHYPLVQQQLQTLCVTGKKYRIIPEDFKTPLIGTANLSEAQITRLGAFANTKYNTIIIDRGLLFFLSNFVRIIVDLITTEIDSKTFIKPSVLTSEELMRRIKQKPNLTRDFLEIMCSYAKFGTVIPFTQFNHLDDSQKGLWHEYITQAMIRFVVAHELMHIVYRHEESTPENEDKADFMATQICNLCVRDLEKDKQLYWVPVLTAAILDMLKKCIDEIGVSRTKNTHPDDRAQYTHYVITKMNVGSYSLALAQATRRIIILMWGRTKNAIIGLAKNERIADIESLKTVISMISIKT